MTSSLMNLWMIMNKAKNFAKSMKIKRQYVIIKTIEEKTSGRIK